jgi:hypothetical protein
VRLQAADGFDAGRVAHDLVLLSRGRSVNLRLSSAFSTNQFRAEMGKQYCVKADGNCTAAPASD